LLRLSSLLLLVLQLLLKLLLRLLQCGVLLSARHAVICGHASLSAVAGGAAAAVLLLLLLLLLLRLVLVVTVLMHMIVFCWTLWVCQGSSCCCVCVGCAGAVAVGAWLLAAW
jgi:hypothetical protein